MVRGLSIFKEHFSKFSHHYVLIGGTACTLAMREFGLDFRATRDLDIVLCLEALDKEFAQAFWQFVKEGGYQQQQKSTGKKLFYRFYAPRNQNYPEMIELFSRVPDIIGKSESHLTPIPIDEEISSLSAILLDTDYYSFIHNGRREIDGLSVITPEYLIPLKIRAWIDLSERRSQGIAVDSKEIRKHKNDVLRLYQLLSLQRRILLPQIIAADFEKFLNSLKQDETIDLKNIGLKNTTIHEMISNLSQIYQPLNISTKE